jgi:hypothetical protein
LGTNNDLLFEQCTQLATFFDSLADNIASGEYAMKDTVLELSEELLKPEALQAVANQLAEELAKKPPGPDKLRMLSEYGEMLASLQKEYYVITNRHARIPRVARIVAGIKHAGNDNGVVKMRMQQAGGAY